MPNSFGSRLRRAWNIFLNKDPTVHWREGATTYYRPDQRRSPIRNEQTIVTAIMNRIALDVAKVQIEHICVDENGRFTKKIQSDLNNCLTMEANVDQTGRAFRQDIAFSILEEGVIAAVPVDTDIDLLSPDGSDSFKIYTMRVGRITGWRPQHVTVSLYNELNGQKEEVTVSKRRCAIIENPFYSVMNAPSSTLQRLIRKLSLLDVIDEQSSSGKLDLIIQLPYVVKTEKQKEQADKRRHEIERQLSGSKYGIAYTDGTERITQLNRAVENNLLSQIEYLQNMLYSQLGITAEIMNGSADEKTMLNYNNRVVEPILSAIANEFTRKFLTKTARTQGQVITFFQDPFSLVPVSSIAEIADKFTRNEIMSPNEIRQIIGMLPSKDPQADELRNRNLSQSNQDIAAKNGNGGEVPEIQNEGSSQE